MALLDRVSVLAGVVSVVATIYDQHRTRQRLAEQDRRDQRVRDLEERIARLEADREGSK